MSKMNLPNKLTMLRLFMVPVMTVFLLLPNTVDWWLSWEWAFGAGLLIFALTSLTDILDGKIARARNLITNFGKFMDPVADKFMVIGTMLAMLFRMMNPELYGVRYQTAFVTVYFVAVLLVIFRELAITSLRLVLVNANGKVVAANMLGKIKTVCQIACICVLFVEPLIEALVLHLGGGGALVGVYVASYVTVGLMLLFTLLSGFFYIKDGIKYISTDW